VAYLQVWQPVFTFGPHFLRRVTGFAFAVSGGGVVVTDAGAWDAGVADLEVSIVYLYVNCNPQSLTYFAFVNSKDNVR
jgi:hypothetical protein